MASGPEDGHLWWSRMPSWDWQRPYEAGDIVHPDVYGAVDGYFYDFVRSIVVGGQPTDGQLALLEAGIGCIHAGCAAAVSGARGKDVYAAVRAQLVEVGARPRGRRPSRASSASRPRCSSRPGTASGSAGSGRS